MDSDLEKSLRDNIDDLTERLKESAYRIEKLMAENKEFRNSVESHLNRISGLNGQVEALTLCIKILAEKL